MKKKLSILLFLVFCITIISPMIYPSQVYAASANVKMIVGGNSYTLALKHDGKVWGWGENTSGQLGDGTTVNKNTPVQIPDFDNVSHIAAGVKHSVALKNDGTVWAWGSNDHGPLGDGTTVNRTSPVQVPNLVDVISISAGEYFTLALKSDGTVWAWGKNEHGRLGDGTTVDKLSPVQISNLLNVTSISAGYGHAIALKSDGTIWTWGFNSMGQLGDGTNVDKHTPVQVSTLTNIMAVCGAPYHTVALKNDGTVWAWGSNSSGQLGDGTKVNKNIPVQASNLSNVTAISTGYSHVAALKSDGTIWAWGSNSSGELGDGTTVGKTTPFQIPNFSNVSLIGTGGYHTLALKNDGTVWAWGRGTDGQLGDGADVNRTAPVNIFTNIVVPNAPQNLTASGGDTDINLNWSEVTGCTGYNIYRATTTGGPYNRIASNVTNMSYSDSSVSAGITYYYTVTGVNDDGESDYSNEANATLETVIPCPQNLTATPGDTQVSLSWNAVTSAVSYNVKRAITTGGPYQTIASNVTELVFADTGLTNGITYYYVVTAVIEGMESPNSNEALATPEATENNRALLVITMVNGFEKEYDLPISEVEAFILWYDMKAAGTGKDYYIMNQNYNLGPFSSRKEYIVFSKIFGFEVQEY